MASSTRSRGAGLALIEARVPSSSAGSPGERQVDAARGAARFPPPRLCAGSTSPSRPSFAWLLEARGTRRPRTGPTAELAAVSPRPRTSSQRACPNISDLHLGARPRALLRAAIARLRASRRRSTPTRSRRSSTGCRAQPVGLSDDELSYLGWSDRAIRREPDGAVRRRVVAAHLRAARRPRRARPRPAPAARPSSPPGTTLGRAGALRLGRDAGAGDTVGRRQATSSWTGERAHCCERSSSGPQTWTPSDGDSAQRLRRGQVATS